MKTLDINQAAEFLHMHPITVGRMAKAGRLPGAKPGKCWVFLDVDLAEWLRTQYQADLSTKISCHFTSAACGNTGMVFRSALRGLIAPIFPKAASL